MEAVRDHEALELLVVAAGSHLIQPALTFYDVKAHFAVADSVPMQIAGKSGRAEDAEAVGRGIARFTRSFSGLAPDWVVVLGDRIEAFAAASAAAIGGWPLAHIHGGDRAEGIADESMRHAITKLAHLHLPATPSSADRIRRMGEPDDRIRVIGSPAIDGLDRIEPMSSDGDQGYAISRIPRIVLLMHPIGRDAADEQIAAGLALRACIEKAGGPEHVLALSPNHDPGHPGIIDAIESTGVPSAAHLPRERFLGLLRALTLAKEHPGILVGNSSAGLIECAALGLPVVDIGTRQNGRERCENAVHADESLPSLLTAIDAARRLAGKPFAHPYGDGQAGIRAAATLADVNPRMGGFTRKICVY